MRYDALAVLATMTIRFALLRYDDDDIVGANLLQQCYRSEQRERIVGHASDRIVAKQREAYRSELGERIVTPLP